MNPFSIKEALKTSWEIVKKNLWFVVGTTFVYLLLNANSSSDGSKGEWQLPHSSVTTWILIIGSVLVVAVALWILRTIVQIGYFRIYLKLLDGIRPNFKELFAHHHPFWRYVGSMILYCLRVLLGFILFVVPGIIWAIKFQFMLVLTVDKGLGPVEAMRESARMTDGHKWQLFKFALVVLVVNLLGLACFIVGILVTVPLTTLAHLYIYRKLLQPNLSTLSYT